MIDWKQIHSEYLSGQVSYRDLARKYGVALSTIGRHAKAEGWQQESIHIDDKVRTELADNIATGRCEALTRAAALSSQFVELLGRQIEGLDPDKCEARVLLTLAQALHTGILNLQAAYSIPSVAEQVSIDRLELDKQKYAQEMLREKQDGDASHVRIVIQLPDGTETEDLSSCAE